FVEIFSKWKPDVFVDTHTSDGADYPYVMTLITTQLSKLHPPLSSFVKKEMEPALYKAMAEAGYEMIPYVDKMGETPLEGIRDFLETPRYSTGYAALFNTIGFTTEAHMLKPFRKRVLATYQFLRSVVDFTGQNADRIEEIRKEADRQLVEQRRFLLNWKLDSTRFDTLRFKGYTAKYISSEVTGLTRIRYDRAAPYEKEIPHYRYFTARDTLVAPYAYMLPAAWAEAVKRLQVNGIEMHRLARDSILEVQVYYIAHYNTISKPYEGHYLHTDVQLKAEMQRINFHRGDYLIPTKQPGKRYIIETLEPNAPDSYFAWNFFDGILQQKEWFSDYPFDDKAKAILENDHKLNRDFELKKANDREFASNKWAMLGYIYKHSEWYERSAMRYPVGRILKVISLPLAD
ncbi:MAG: hypothetical protein ACE5DN_05460, partial [Flavobacteriales bacterium]